MAFNEGNREFWYEFDDGETYTKLVRDYSNSQIDGVYQDAVALLTSEDPPTGLTEEAIPASVRFEPRYVWWQASTGGKRRKLTCFSPDADLYKDLGAEVTIEGIAGRIVGRVGERASIRAGNVAP